MGQSKSKALHHPQYALPPGYPQYGPVYTYPVVPQVAYPPGYHAPVIPPGYGPVVIPPPPVTDGNGHRNKKEKHASSSDGRKYRSTGHKRHRSAPLNVQPMPAGMFDNLPAGFVPNNIIPNIPGGTNPVIPQALNAITAQGDHPAPLFTPGVSDIAALTSFPSSEPPVRRAATPWVNSVPSDTSDEEDDSQQRTSHHRSRSFPHRRIRSTSRYRQDPRREITADDPRAALEVREPNPLPVPPRDIFASSPYQHLLHPSDITTSQNRKVGHDPSKTTISRSGTLPGIAGVGAGVNAALPQTKKKKGLFSFGSLRNRRNAPVIPQSTPEYAHGYAPSVYPNMSHSRSASGHAPVVGFNDAPRAGSPEPQRSPPIDDDESSDEDHLPPTAHRPITPGSPHPHPQSGPTSSQPHTSQSQPVLSPSHPFLLSPNGSTIEFSQRSLPEFLNHSPHRVLYGNKTYPTAMHLHEAMKFLEHKPDLAEAIRQCEKIEDVYPAALSFQVWVRPDWANVFLDKMEDVLWAKFTQHPDLRSTLLKTGNCRIVYADTQDSYWGSGSDIGHPGNYTGYNYLGNLLEKVRDKLRMEGYSA